jgi:hypothetical protein
MSNHYTDNLRPGHYDWQIEMAARHLGVLPDQVLSIKLRPVYLKEREYLDSYVPDEIYEELFEKLKLRYPSGIEGNFRDGSISKNVLFFSHESGPEIFLISSLLTAMDNFNIVVDFISTFAPLLCRKLRKNSRNDVSMRIEVREMGKKSELIKTIDINNVDNNTAVQIVQEVLNNKSSKKSKE